MPAPTSIRVLCGTPVLVFGVFSCFLGSWGWSTCHLRCVFLYWVLLDGASQGLPWCVHKFISLVLILHISWTGLHRAFFYLDAPARVFRDILGQFIPVAKNWAAPLVCRFALEGRWWLNEFPSEPIDWAQTGSPSMRESLRSELRMSADLWEFWRTADHPSKNLDAEQRVASALPNRNTASQHQQWHVNHITCVMSHTGCFPNFANFHVVVHTAGRTSMNHIMEPSH